jgi:tetratricopeptide (TPR) repeat protein
MSWRNKLLILCLLTNSLFVQSAFCQNLAEIVSFSDESFEAGNFELAANEYNRALFFGCPEQDQICLKIASCYFKQQKYEQSIQFYDRAYFSSTSDSIRTEAILGKAFALIIIKNYLMALTELINVDSAKNTYHDVKLHFLKGITYFGLHEDELSEKSFKTCLAMLSLEKDSLLDLEFKEIKKSEKRFNPHTAWMLSMILPGTGQFYAGEVMEGFNSSLLLGGLFFSAVLIAKEYSFFIALVTILPWFQRYYMGGANKAERLTMEKQMVKRNDSYQSILLRIEQANVKYQK